MKTITKPSVCIWPCACASCGQAMARGRRRPAIRISSRPVPKPGSSANASARRIVVVYGPVTLNELPGTGTCTANSVDCAGSGLPAQPGIDERDGGQEHHHRRKPADDVGKRAIHLAIHDP